jgi:hypothetical protein
LFVYHVYVIFGTVAHNLGSETKKATGIPMFNAIGQCGSVLGSHLFPKTDGPRYMYVLFHLLQVLVIRCLWCLQKRFCGFV